MLFSIALILLAGLAVTKLCQLLKLPPLAGMLVCGILIGPYCLNLIDPSILNISSEIRRMALVIILIRAGLNLKIEDLKKAGRAAVLMCFVPALAEICGMVLLAPLIFGLSLTDSILLGTVIAAVSPAVIVPHMLKIMDEGYGRSKAIPQLILAGASCDDVFVIVLFTCFADIAAKGSFEPLMLLRIPTSILLGIAGGWLIGILLSRLFKNTKGEPAILILILLSLSFLLLKAEDSLQGMIGFSGLIAIMAMGMSFAMADKEKASQASAGFSALWKAGEIFLFVLVGAAVNIRYALLSGPRAVLLIALVLLFRMAGVLLCMVKTKLNTKERLFCMFAYTPKATVQAAIGAIPLSMGIASGEIILTCAVIAILLTAPLGAFTIDLTYPKWLSKDESEI